LGHDITPEKGRSWKAERHAMRERSTRPRNACALFVVAALEACARPAVVSRATAFTSPGVDATGAPRYAVVHVDHLQAGGLRRFATARKVWLDVLARHGTTDGRGLYLQTGDSGFLSLRPLRTLGELDGAPAAMKAALADLDPRDQKAYDDASDALLVPPHRNEIWRFDPDLSFAAADPIASLAAAAWGKMIAEEIDPSPAGADYEKAWAEIRAALEHEGYPLVRVAYWSRYGSGNLVSFWLSKSQVEFLHTKPVEATVEAALGAEKASELFARQRKAVLASDSIDVIPRIDLSTKPL
jgi:hypothetical protein